MARESQIPKFQIRWLTNRLHVAATDEEVRKNIVDRMKPELYTPAAIKRAGEYAIKCHHENQGIVKKFHL